MSSNRLVWRRQTLNRVAEPPIGGPSGRAVPKTTIRSGSGAETGFSRTELTTEKMAVLAPMPSARAATAVAVNAGVWRKIRREYLRSLRKASVMEDHLG